MILAETTNPPLNCFNTWYSAALIWKTQVFDRTANKKDVDTLLL